MKKLILLLATAAAPLFSFAQGCITIFSEDGDRFYLVLNGVKQNPTPQTNVHIDGLNNQYYSAKILFEDKTKPEITKNIPVTDPGTNDFADVTYKIKRTKSGQMVMRYFSATPIVPNYVAPPDMYVMHYGQAPVATSGTVTQTTQTTTVSSAAPNGANVNINAGGMNMNVNIQDPDGGGGVSMNMNVNDGSGYTRSNSTTTTTTTYTTTSSSTTAQPVYNSQPVQGSGCGYAMTPTDFAAAKQTIGKSSFDDTKLSTAKSILASNCMSTDQIMQVCKMFSFEDNKLEFAKHAYSRCTDPKNYFKIGSIFTFDSNKEALNEFIGQ